MSQGDQVKEIAEMKVKDLNSIDVEGARCAWSKAPLGRVELTSSTSNETSRIHTAEPATVQRSALT